MCKRKCGLIVAFAVLASSPLLPGTSPPLPVGGQFQVNSYTTGTQGAPAVSSAADGGFVVVWTSNGSSGGDTLLFSVQGQRYSADGTPAGSQFQINTYTTSNQSSPALSLTPDGSFVVVWSSNGSSGGDVSGRSIQGQRYDANGAALGSQFQVNTFGTSTQNSPVVSAAAGGDFVVAWDSNGSSGGDSSSYSAQGQLYLASGTPVGGQFQVNSYSTNAQYYPAVAAAANGDFMVVWESTGSSGGDTSDDSVQGQRFAANGSPVGSQFQVNSYTTSYQSLAAISSTPDGDVVVVWQSDGSSGTDSLGDSIQGQRYAANGAPQGSQFQVNTYTPSEQLFPAVAADTDGDFVVTWASFGSSGGDTSSYSIHGQRFATSGAPVGGQFQINSYTSGSQRFPAVSADANGDFVVVWESVGSAGGDSSLESVQGQRFRVTGDLQGRAFFDLDADGIQDAGEPGLANVAVELYDDALTLRRTTATDGSGNYFLKPKEGSWRLRFLPPPGFGFSPQDVGGNDAIDSDADPLTGETDPFLVSINTLDSTIDAGFTDPLFNDGFESGNTSAWSSTLP